MIEEIVKRPMARRCVARADVLQQRPWENERKAPMERLRKGKLLDRERLRKGKLQRSASDKGKLQLSATEKGKLQRSASGKDTRKL